MKNDTISIQFCKNNYQHSEVRQGLRNVVNCRFSENRPISIGEFTPDSYRGGQTLKVRRPDLGEIGLSDAEIEHAIVYGITI
jgi:hypothetical protein